MIARSYGLAAGLVALSLVWVTVARAEPRTQRGVVVSAAANKLVIKDGAGSDQSFTVEMGTSVVVHGKPGKLEDLQQTMLISVTTDEKGKVLAVATIDKHKHSVEFAWVGP